MILISLEVLVLNEEIKKTCLYTLNGYVPFAPNWLF